MIRKVRFKPSSKKRRPNPNILLLRSQNHNEYSLNTKLFAKIAVLDAIDAAITYDDNCSASKAISDAKLNSMTAEYDIYEGEMSILETKQTELTRATSALSAVKATGSNADVSAA